MIALWLNPVYLSAASSKTVVEQDVQLYVHIASFAVFPTMNSLCKMWRLLPCMFEVHWHAAGGGGSGRVGRGAKVSRANLMWGCRGLLGAITK